MKKLLATLIFINLTIGGFCTQIGVSFSTEKISIWRYWEKIDNEFTQKLLLINTSDSIVEISIKEILFKGYNLEKDTSKTIVVVSGKKIESLGFAIIDFETIELNQVSDIRSESRYLNFFVNGESIGLVPSKFESPPKELEEFNYISPLGLSLPSSSFWVAKNNLFSTKKELDSIVLVYKNINKPAIRKEEQFWINFQPTNNFLKFEISTNGTQKGYYDKYNIYRIQVPYTFENPPNITSRITIKYIATKKTELYLGLICDYGIKIKHERTRSDELTNNVLYSDITLPILIK